MSEPLRNQPCPCGSGRRYKHCCGGLGAVVPSVNPDADVPEVRRLMDAALDAQLRRRLDDAERFYRAALAIKSDLPDALHMLGVIRYERKDYDEALGLMTRALDLTDWKFESYRHNLGLVLSQANSWDVTEVLSERGRAYREWQRRRRGVVLSNAPLVSVVIPSFNHERYVEEAIQSVLEQSYPQLELVVIDDGSVDRSAELIRAALRRSPYPHRFIARENRGAAATINEGIGLSAGSYINILNSDDRFHPERIAKMVREVAVPGATWGFATCSLIDDSGKPADPLRDAKAHELSYAMAAISLHDTVGFAFLAQNVAISTGNLFFSRDLWSKLQGFQGLRYNHDWDFALRALWEAEPTFVAEELYVYRIHPANTISESRDRARAEADLLLDAYLRRALTVEGMAPNTFAPCVGHWGMRFVWAVLRGGLGKLVDPGLLRQLVVSLGREGALGG